MQETSKTYFITLNINSEKKNQGWTPVLTNTFSLRNKLGRQSINTHGIEVAATSRRVPGPKAYTSHLLEGRLKVWTAGGKLQSKTQTEPLELLRNASSICRVDVQLIKPFAAGKYLLKSLDRIIKAGIFVEWMLLKCEATNISFSNVRDEVEIFSVNDFRALKHLISQTTSLPLPFVYKDQELGTRYFFINFRQAINSKISKLNTRIFFDVDTRKEILVTCDLGIRLDESYVDRIKKFRFYVGKTLVNYVTQHMLEIKRLIVYNHILWGFLQDWVKRLYFEFCKTYSLETIATSLSLHKIDLNDVKRLSESSGRPSQVFFIASFSEFALYLRFTSTTQGHFSFEIDNIETPIVSTTSVVQYYRQFFYINDTTKTNALECLLDYSTLNKNFLQVSDVVEFNKAKIKTRTVEQINQLIEIQKETEKREKEAEELRTEAEKRKREAELRKAESEKEADIPINEETIIKLLKSGSIPKDKVKDHLLPFVRESLDECFARNSIEIMCEDETNDTSKMVHKFQEAVARADTTASFQSFLENIYNNLQLFFTNSSSQKLMNCMIYKELENRFSDKNGQEFVGERELKQLFGPKENPLKRKNETPEDDSNPKMPNLMPLKKFLKLEKEREKDDPEMELKPCSVVLKKFNLDEKIDENKHKLEPQNFMVKFSKYLFTKNPESDEASTTNSDSEPVLKSQKFWDDEKLYRECLTSKTKVILHKLEDTVGLKNKDEKVKLKKRKISTDSEASSTKNSILHDCFDITDGKVTLKPGYECKDGYIIPVKNQNEPGYSRGEEPLEILRNILSQKLKEKDMQSSRKILSPPPQEKDLDIMRKIISPKSKPGPPSPLKNKGGKETENLLPPKSKPAPPSPLKSKEGKETENVLPPKSKPGPPSPLKSKEGKETENVIPPKSKPAPPPLKNKEGKETENVIPPKSKPAPPPLKNKEGEETENVILPKSKPAPPPLKNKEGKETENVILPKSKPALPPLKNKEVEETENVIMPKSKPAPPPLKNKEVKETENVILPKSKPAPPPVKNKEGEETENVILPKSKPAPPPVKNKEGEETENVIMPKSKPAPPPLKNREGKETENEPDLFIIDESDDIEVIQVKKLEIPDSTKRLSKKLIKCGLCSRQFDLLSDLEEHEKNFHANVSTYKCNVCNKRFYYFHYLEYHKKTKHEKSLHCEYCDVVLQDSGELEVHLSSEMHKEKRMKHVVVLDV